MTLPPKLLVYLYGYPGVGKSTIARHIAEKTDLIAIQSHLISNAFRHVLKHKDPAQYKNSEHLIKHHTMKAWLNFLDFVDAAVPDQGLIFTSVLYQDDPERVEYFDFIRLWALRQNRILVPVRLNCAPQILKQRVTSSERNSAMKLTDADVLEKLMARHTLLTPDTPHFLDIDTTDHSAIHIADTIIDALKNLF